MNLKNHLLVWLWLLISVLASAESSYSGGDGTQANPYQITTVADLQELATAVNSGTTYDDIYFLLKSDLDLSGVTWTPIGSYKSSSVNKPFKGVFNGNHQTISNLTISATTDYQGLFGYAITGSIDSLHLINANVSGKGYVGGILGRGDRVTYCSFNGVVSGTGSYVGGLVGRLDKQVYACMTTGLISSTTSSVGGLLGTSNSSSTAVDYCHSAMTVRSTGTAGGLVGSNYGTVEHSLFTGTLVLCNADASSVARASEANKLENNFYDAQMSFYAGNSSAEDAAGQVQGKLTSEMTGNALETELGDMYVYETGMYPRLKFIADKGFAKLAALPLLLSTNSNTSQLRTGFTLPVLTGLTFTTEPTLTTVLTIANGNVSVDRTILNADSVVSLIGKHGDLLRIFDFKVMAPEYVITYDSVLSTGRVELYKGSEYISSGSSISKGTELKLVVYPINGYMPDTRKLTVNSSDETLTSQTFLVQGATRITVSFKAITAWDGTVADFVDGDGSSSDRYKIYSPQQLAKIQALCAAGEEFSSKYFSIENDLDLNGAQHPWIPIGTDAVNFKGNIAGNGHVIKNMKVVSTSDYVGFIGYGGNGKVDNLIFENASVEGASWVGGVVGRGSGQIDNVLFKGTVKGSGNFVGGLVGQTSGTIARNLVYGSVEGEDVVGGVMGYSSATFIRYNASMATVKGDSCVGGIAGSFTGGIEDNAVSADVIGRLKVGGIAGTSTTSAKIFKSYFSGALVCTEDSAQMFGSIIGTSLATSTTTKNFYNQQLSIYGGANNEDVAGKHTGVNPEIMLGEAFLDSLKSTEMIYLPHYMPRSKYYDTLEPVSVLMSTPILLSAGETPAEVSQSFKLGTAQGLTWAERPMASILAFVGDSARVTLPEEATTLALVAQLKGLEKVWNLSFPAAPMEPTAKQAPYLLRGAVYGEAVQLTWRSPVIRKDLRWHQNYAYNGKGGSGNFAEIWGAALFEASDIQEFVGKKVDSIGFHPYHSVIDATLVIYENDSEIYRQVVDGKNLKYKEENHFKLTQAYEIKADVDVKFALKFRHGSNSEFVAIIDKGPIVSGKGDLFSNDGITWTPNDLGNFYITAFLEVEGEASATPVGYNVYRNGEKVNTQLLANTSVDLTKQPIGTHSYTVKAVYPDQSESEASATVSLTIIDPMSLRGSPIQLRGSAEEMKAILSWKAPILDPQKLRWITTEKDSLSVGFTGSSPKATVVNYFSAEEVANLSSHEITAIRAHFAGVPTFVKIVIFQNDQLVYCDTVSTLPTSGQWNRLVLKTPYRIQVGKDLHVGYFVRHTKEVRPVSLDGGPYIEGRANVLSASEDGGNWTTLYQLSNKSLPYNWLLEAELSKVAGAPAPLTVQSYDVYRDGVKVSTATTLTTEDEVAAPGTYEYQVLARYSDQSVSPLSTPVDVEIEIPSEYASPTFTENRSNLDTVVLQWDLNVAADKLIWCDDEPGMKFGLGNDGQNVNMGFGALFTRDDLRAFAGYEIVSITTAFAEEVLDAQAVIVADGATVAKKDMDSLPVASLIETTFTTPYEIPSNKNILIGFLVEHADGFKPVMVDKGPAVPNKGDMFSLDLKKWYSFTDLPTVGLNNNIYVWANVRKKNTDGPTQVLGVSRPKAGVELKGFHVYRNGQRLTQEPISEKTFTDIGLEVLNTYSYTVTAVYANGWESDQSKAYTYTYRKPNALPGPLNLENHGDTNVILRWEEPKINDKISWARTDTNARMSIGFTGSSEVNAYILHAYTPADLASFSQATVTHIGFELSHADLKALKVCVLYDEMVIYEQDVLDWKLGENIVSLDMPIAIDPTRNLMVGYYAAYMTGVKPHAMDFGPAVDTKGNMTSTNQGYSFKTLLSMNSKLDYNWMISAYLDMEVDPQQMPSGLQKSSVLDSAMTYRVYANDQLLASSLLMPNYRSSLPKVGTYYYVKALYGKATESAPSNKVWVSGTGTAIRPNQDGSFQIWPNPCTDMVQFNGEKVVRTINLFDMNQRLLRRIEVAERHGVIEVDYLPSGTYLLQFIFADEVVVRKIVKP